MPGIDWSLRFGDLLVILSALGGGVALVLKWQRDETKQGLQFAEIGPRLQDLEIEMKKQTTILERLAAGDERMRGLERRLELIENARVA